MGFKRPLVQIQSLGPKRNGHARACPFFFLVLVLRRCAARRSASLKFFGGEAHPLPNPPHAKPALAHRTNQRPLALSIHGRGAAWAASIAAQAAGSNPVTRTKKCRISEEILHFFYAFGESAKRNSHKIALKPKEGHFCPSLGFWLLVLSQTLADLVCAGAGEAGDDPDGHGVYRRTGRGSNPVMALRHKHPIGGA